MLLGLSTIAPDSGLHTSDMQRDQFAWILNTTNGTAENSGVWSRDSVGYPIFADSLHLPIYKVVFDDSGATTNRYTNYKGLVSFPEDPEAPEGKSWYTDDGVKVKSSTVFTKDQTVHAVYNASDIYFSIRFFNADTTLLDSQYVQYGKTPIYGGTPTLASTAKYSYTFEGWHVEPTAATEDFDYYAVYSETLRSYTVRFLDFDGTELQSSTYLYGATPGVSKTPTRKSTVAYDYTFKGWEPALKSVTGDAVYTAVFDSTKVPQSGSSAASSSSSGSSGSSEASSSSGKSSSSEASSSSSAKSSSSSAVENSSSSSENPDVLVANLPAPTWSVTVSGRNFQVHAAPVGKPYALFDLQGKVLAKGRIESSEMTLSAPRAGSYIVRIGNRSVRMNAK